MRFGFYYLWTETITLYSGRVSVNIPSTEQPEDKLHWHFFLLQASHRKSGPIFLYSVIILPSCEVISRRLWLPVRSKWDTWSLKETEILLLGIFCVLKNQERLPLHISKVTVQYNAILFVFHTRHQWTVLKKLVNP